VVSEPSTRSNRRLPWWLAPPLLVALCLQPAWAKVKVEPSGPAKNPTTTQDFLRHPHDDRYYQESWTAIMRSRQGHIFYLNFLYTNLGVFSGSTAVNVSLAQPGKMARHYRYDYKISDFKQYSGKGMIAIGPNSMTLQGKSMSLVVKEKDLALDLELQGWVDGVKLHSGRLYLKEDKSQWVDTYFHLPRADVNGEMVVEGQNIAFEGDGYVDHMVQNVLGTDYSTRWHTLRFFAPDHTVAFISWDTPWELGRERVVRLLVTDRKEILTFTDRMELVTDQPKKDAKGHSYNNHFRFSTAGKGGPVVLEGELTGQRLHDRDVVLDRLSWAERKVAGMVAGNPIFYRLEAPTKATLTVAGQQPVQLSGQGLIESVVMQEE